MSQSFTIRDHFFSLLFPNNSQYLKSLTSGSGGKNMFKRGEHMKKKICKIMFSPRRFYTLHEQKLSNIVFPQGFKISKKFGHWTLGSGKKRPISKVRKCDGQTDKQTNKHMDILTYRKHRPRGPSPSKNCATPQEKKKIIII